MFFALRQFVNVITGDCLPDFHDKLWQTACFTTLFEDVHFLDWPVLDTWFLRAWSSTIHFADFTLAQFPLSFAKIKSSRCDHYGWNKYRIQESCAAAREPHDATAVAFGLKFADNVHYKFKSSQASKARLQSSKRTGAKRNAKWPF